MDAKQRVERGDLESYQRSIQLHLQVALKAMELYANLVESTETPLERRRTSGFVQPVTVTDVKSARTRLKRMGEEIASFRRPRARA
jgi:hypothetical protein